MKNKLLQILKKYSHAWVFLYTAVYLSWFRYLETTITKDFYVMHSKIDDIIPFNEFFIIPYLFWFLYITITLFFLFFKDKDEFYKFSFTLAVGMSVSMLICQIFPNGTNLRPVIDFNKNWATALVAFIYKTDTSTNVFPSIHVYNSIATHIAVCRSKFFINNKLIKGTSFIIMLLICISTVTLKQHSIIDVVGAVFLISIVNIIFYPKVEPVVKKEELGAKI